MYNILFSSDIRTNNYLESFHAMLLNQMGKHPNIWDFLRKLNFIINYFILFILELSANNYYSLFYFYSRKIVVD